MQTTIDKAGRLVLPKAMRDRLGLRAGDVLDLEESNDGLHLRQVLDADRLVKIGHVLVFAAGQVQGADTDVVQAHRDERIGELVRQAMS